ncbi:hypothetical protein QRE66_29830 (plasmid) [Bacillus cereus]|nr:hypothetical protein QRE66_29830 [Bacillus cereus]
MELILLVGGDSLTLTVISSNSALAYGIREMLVLPYHNQAKKSKYPKTRKLASPGENVQFFVLGAL